MRGLKLLAAAAAAAMVLGAGPAQAATWVVFQIQGVGLETSYNFQVGNTPSLRTGEIVVRFVIDVEPLPAGVFSPYDADGRTFRFDQGVLRTTADASTPGRIDFDLDNFFNTRLAPDIDVTVNYNSTTGVFPATLPTTAATGTIDFSTFGATTARSITGTVTSFGTAGRAAGFEQATITFLPEPASWAMMILGAGVVGGVLRRRQRPASAIA